MAEKEKLEKLRTELFEARMQATLSKRFYELDQEKYEEAKRCKKVAQRRLSDYKKQELLKDLKKEGRSK